MDTMNSEDGITTEEFAEALDPEIVDGETNTIGATLKVRLLPSEHFGNKRFTPDFLTEKAILDSNTNKALLRAITGTSLSPILRATVKRKGLNYLDNQIKASNLRSSSEDSREAKIENFKFFRVLNKEILRDSMILHTTDGIKYTTKIEDYLYEGLKDVEYNDETKEKKLGVERIGDNENELDIKVNYTTITVSSNGKARNTINGNDFQVIDKERNKIFVLDENKLETIIIGKDGRNYDTEKVVDLSDYGTIKQIRLDKNKNFLSILVEKEGKYSIHILNSTGTEEYQSIENIQVILCITKTNDILCLDDDNKVRLINTNFQNFDKNFQGNIGKIKELAKEEAIKVLRAGISIGSQEKGKNTELVKEIYNTTLDIEGNKTTLQKLMDKASSEKDFQQIDIVIHNMKAMEIFSKIPGLFNSIEIEVKDKSNKIKLEKIYAKIDEINDALAQDIDISTYTLYKRDLETIIKERGTINIATNDKDQKAGVLLAQIKRKIKEIKKDSIEEVTSVIDDDLGLIGSLLENILYQEHIENIYSSIEYKECLNLIELLDGEEKIEKRKELNKLIQDKVNELQKNALEDLKEEQKEIETNIKEIKRDFIEVNNILELQNEETNILKIKTKNGLVINLYDRIFQLPLEHSERLAKELDDLFAKKIRSIRFGQKSFKTTGNIIDLGDGSKAEKFVADVNQTVSWSLKGKRNNGEIIIYFENSVGGKIEPSIEKMYRLENPLAVSKEDFAVLQDWIKKWENRYKKVFYKKLHKFKSVEREYLEEIEKEEKDKEKFESIKKKYEKTKEEWGEIKAKSYLARMFHKLPRNKLSARPLVPSIEPGTVIGPTTKTFLQEFSNLAEEQVESKGAGAGIVIVEGDAGTGKNFKINLYAHLTNREVFEMQGNKTAQKEDLLYSYELGPDGTYRLPSHLIKGIQTPGAIIVLDEINTYPPEVLKLLNPLLDGRRYINDPQLGRVDVHPSVIIVGLMNPQNYLGTNPLSQEIVSRAVIMKDHYPAEFSKDQKPSWEEAYLISRHLKSEVGNMDEDTFISLWDKIVLKGQDHNDHDIEKIFDELWQFIKLINKLRNLYQDTQKDIGTEELNFIFSLREGIQVMQRYDKSGDIQKSIINIVLPKIVDNDEKELVENQINLMFENV